MTAPVDFTVPVRIDVPIAAWKHLHRIAEHERVAVGAVVLECIRRALTSGAPAETDTERRVRLKSEQHAARNDRIQELHSQGLSDSAIATHLGITGRRVQQLRIALGLPRLHASRWGKDT